MATARITFNVNGSDLTATLDNIGGQDDLEANGFDGLRAMKHTAITFFQEIVTGVYAIKEVEIL
jgi:hypothetical protein